MCQEELEVGEVGGGGELGIRVRVLEQRDRVAQLLDGGIVIGLDDGVAFLNSDGSLRAKAPAATSDARYRAKTTTPAVLSNGIVAIGGSDAKLSFYDPSSGTELWKVELGPWPSRYDGIRSSVLEVRDSDGRMGAFFSLLDGTVMRLDLDYFFEQLEAGNVSAEGFRSP